MLDKLNALENDFNGQIVNCLKQADVLNLKSQILGKKGRARIVETFCWNVAAETFTNYYHEVIAKHANR